MKNNFDEITGYELMCKECEKGCLKCHYQYICNAVTEDLKPSEWSETDKRRFKHLINQCIKVMIESEV